jgi:hypothetical protein
MDYRICEVVGTVLKDNSCHFCELGNGIVLSEGVR